MSTALQLRRGTTAQHSTFTGLVGELTVDTDKKTVVVHDGATAGGMPLLPKTMNDGTANGVAYLNGSKVLTTGSALTFDGSSMVLNTSTSSDALRITQTGTGNALLVEDSANPDSSPFVVGSGGNVGIGKLNPGVSLQIENATQAAIYLDTGSNNSQISFRRFNTSVTSPTIVSSGNDLGIIEFDGYDGTAQRAAAWIRASVDGTPGTNDMPGRLVFSTTADGASSPTERMRIGSHGGVGLGVSGSSNVDLYIGRALTGATAYGVLLEANAGSDVTATGRGFSTVIGTAASAFTLPDIQHYRATQGTFGAGSTVTGQYGYFAHGNLTGATNNYGFFSNIAAGTGRWNFYAAGTADNYFAGNVGVGTASLTGRLNVAGGTIEFDPGSGADTTRAFNFNISSQNYAKLLVPSGSGGALAFWVGVADSATERMRIDSAGQITIGTSQAAGQSVRLVKPTTGSTYASGFISGGAVQSDVTNRAALFQTSASTAAASFTLSQLMHVYAEQGTFGAGSAVTSQFGYYAHSNLTSATNNYGFYGNIAVGTGRYNLYMAGSADNVMAGRLSIGNTPYTDTSLRVDIPSTVTGADTWGVYSSGSIPTTATASWNGFTSAATTSANAYTVANYRHFHAPNITPGAGSTITNLYGFYSNIASGTGRYNFYAAGTAANYFAGRVGVGITDPQAELSVEGNLYASIGTNSASNAPTQTFYRRRIGGAAVISGDNLGLLTFSGLDGTGAIPAAQISATVDGTPGTNDMPGRLVFSTTADGASSPTERLRIDSEGRCDMRTSMASGGGTGTASSISGTTLTVGGTVAGTFAVGDRIWGAGVEPNTFITALDTGTGGAGTYTVSNSQTVSSTAIYAIGGGFNVFRFTDTDATAAANQPMGTIEWYGYDTSTPGAGVKAYIAGISESITPDSALIFGTSDNVASTQAVERWRINSSGTLTAATGSGLSIASTAVTAPAASDGNVFSGTYTPTLTNVTNVAASTAYLCQYMRVGNSITVSGIVNIDPTATGAFRVDMTIPVGTIAGSSAAVGGTFMETGSGASWGAVTVVPGGGGTVVRFNGQSPTSTSNQGFAFTFTYRIA